MFNWLRNKPKPPSTRVTMNGETVHVLTGDTEVASFHWRNVLSIPAWKEDCFAVDCIWLGFDIQGRDEAVCVHEEMEGYEALVEELQRRCPGYLQHWRSAVAFPAFALNHKFIWHSGRSAPAQSQDPPA